MLDIKYVRENAENVQKFSEQKGCKVDVKRTLELDAERRSLMKEVEDLRKEKNDIADRSKGGKPTQEDIDKGKEIKAKLAEMEPRLETLENDFLSEFKKIPNIPSGDVPVGLSEDENVISKVVGEKRDFTFPIKNHWQLAEAKGWIDKERAGKVSGARFAYLKGDLVRLEWALINFAVDILTDEKLLGEIIKKNNLKVSPKAFIPVLPPYMIRTAPYDAMDRLEPREERYKIEGEDLWLQGSAEHVLGSMHQDEIFEEKDMPVRYVGFATSFRKEAGSAGKDMEGVIYGT
jgi:seryl-tRNA synthetase